ncbi:MAG: alpha-1,2-fucosyltransferase, partial [Opitutaceae bacterium]|nr:alpha-1,2-fucosyltransferase [Cytophagales bacterium]
MIIVQLKGGLGNQLFQYAAGLSLATLHNVKVKVDISALKKPDEAINTLRNFDLQHINFPPKIATQAEIDELVKSDLVTTAFQKLLPPFKRKIYKEASFNFDPKFYRAGNHLYLKGYRQSVHYFKNIKDKVWQQFGIQSQLINHLQVKANDLQSTNSVSVHIRRGDYSDKKVTAYHGVLPLNYYKSAFEYMNEKVKNARFLIFTDDVKWVSENMTLPVFAEFVSGSITENYYED